MAQQVIVFFSVNVALLACTVRWNATVAKLAHVPRIAARCHLSVYPFLHYPFFSQHAVYII